MLSLSHNLPIIRMGYPHTAWNTQRQHELPTPRIVYPSASRHLMCSSVSIGVHDLPTKDLSKDSFKDSRRKSAKQWLCTLYPVRCVHV